MSHSINANKNVSLRIVNRHVHQWLGPNSVFITSVWHQTSLPLQLSSHFMEYYYGVLFNDSGDLIQAVDLTFSHKHYVLFTHVFHRIRRTVASVIVHLLDNFLFSYLHTMFASVITMSYPTRHFPFSQNLTFKKVCDKNFFSFQKDSKRLFWF